MHDAVKNGPFVHNAMPVGSLSCVLQNLLSYLNPPEINPEQFHVEDADAEKRLIKGAKVIRLQASKWTAGGAYRFLTESFPCARYVINIRSDLDRQAQSIETAFGGLGWNGNGNGNGNDRPTLDWDTSAIRQNVEKQTDFLRELANRLGGQRAKLIDMDEWKGDVSVLNNVVDWLGFEECAFDKIAHENHDNYGQDDRQIYLGDKCRYPHV